MHTGNKTDKFKVHDRERKTRRPPLLILALGSVPLALCIRSTHESWELVVADENEISQAWQTSSHTGTDNVWRNQFPPAKSSPSSSARLTKVRFCAFVPKRTAHRPLSLLVVRHAQGMGTDVLSGKEQRQNYKNSEHANFDKNTKVKVGSLSLFERD